MGMRAWQVHEHGSPEEVLRLVDLAVPQPGPGELRVSVAAAAIGMPDVFMCRGTYRLTPALPFVPGQEVCGIVDAVGDGVDVAVGTRVMGVTSFFDGRGGFADFAIMYPSTIYRVPESMQSDVAAAFRIGYSTAWTGLVRRGGLQPGEWLVVLGAAGGSGASAIQLGCALGARVIAVAAGEEKLAFCKRLGAQAVIDRTKGSVRDAILAATDGHGADVIYDPVGGATAADALQALASFGRFLVVGFASGQWLQVSGGDLTLSNRSVIGVIAHAGTPEEHADAHERMLTLAADGALDAPVTTVPFDHLSQAVDAVAAGTVIGKMVVQVDAGDHNN
jgi:NADPH:quinone reductase